MLMIIAPFVSHLIETFVLPKQLLSLNSLLLSTQKPLSHTAPQFNEVPMAEGEGCMQKHFQVVLPAVVHNIPNHSVDKIGFLDPQMLVTT